MLLPGQEVIAVQVDAKTRLPAFQRVVQVIGVHVTVLIEVAGRQADEPHDVAIIEVSIQLSRRIVAKTEQLTNVRSAKCDLKGENLAWALSCLLYTSDAADE